MDEITDLRGLDFGTKIIIKFSEDEIYDGVIFSEIIRYHDGYADLVSTVEHSILNGKCVVYSAQ